LPNNPEINRALASCLDSNESLIRINAYKILAANNDPHILSKNVGDRFVLDVVESSGPPLIYATRVGEPRIVVFGSKTQLKLPMTFSAFDTQLTIATHPTRPGLLSIFYRGEELQEPVTALASPRVYDLTARLAGAGDDKLRFGYGDIVGMLQSMADSGKVAATFVLQEQPGINDILTDTPDGTGGREVGEPVPATRADGAAGTAPKPVAGNVPPAGRPN
jgi:hypothetical protein